MRKTFIYPLVLAVSMLSLTQESEAQLLTKASGGAGAMRQLEVLPANFRAPAVGMRTPGYIPVANATDFTASAIAPSRGKLSTSSTSSTSVPLYAVVLSSTQWPSYNSEVGVYKLPTNTVPERLEAEAVGGMKMYANGGAVCTGDRLYANNWIVYDGATIYPVTNVFDTETWEYIGVVDGDVTSIAQCMTYDDNTGNIYGCFFSGFGSSFNFATFNPATGSSTRIKSLGTKSWSACAVSPTGQLYAIDGAGMLYTVNKSTGDMAEVGATGVTSNYLCAATFDPFSGKLYYVATPQQDHSYLYEINPSTAQATLLYALPGGEQVAGLFVPNLTSSMEAPGEASGLEAVFDGPSLSGQVRFTAPDVTFEGSPLSGPLGYTVRIDGVDYASGTVQAGAQATADVTVSTVGMHDFTVVCSNDKGNGARAKVSVFVGTDTPPVVKNVVLTGDGSNLTLTWEPLTEGKNGGWIDTDNLTYTVTRYPGGVKVMDGSKATSFTEPMPQADGVVAFYYTVYATTGGEDTAPVESNRYVSGAFTAPYLQDFNDNVNRDFINAYTLIDANGDDKTWSYFYYAGYKDGMMRLYYNANKPMDDWLITPPIYLEGGKQYEFSLNACTFNDMSTETFEVYYGTAPTVSGMTDELIPSSEVCTASVAAKVRFGEFFIPSQTGTYYFGIHAISPANTWYLHVDDIAVSAPKSVNTPLAVTGLTVTPDNGGAHQARITCVAPTKSATGADLASLTKIEISRDDIVIATLSDGVLPGMTVNYLDNAPGIGRGMHKYTVVAYNEEGMGNPVSASVYIGVNLPKAPLSATSELTANVGEVKVSWVPCDLDVDGNPINTDLIRYTILTTNTRGEIYELVTDLTDTEYIFQAVAPGESQRLINFAIIPVTDAGMGSLIQTDPIAVGPSYTMPFADSFAQHTTDKAFGMMQYDEEDYSSWGYYADNSFDDSGLSYTLRSQDGDNGFIGYTSKVIGAVSGFRSGRIAVNNGGNATFSFWHFVSNADNNNEIQVVAHTMDGVAHTVKTFTSNHNPDNVGQWEKVLVPLDEFAGQDVMLEIIVTCTGYAREFFDNLRVYNNVDYNIQAVAIEANNLQTVGTNRPITAVIENFGAKKAEGYTVELFRDGESVATADGPALDLDQVGRVTFRQDFAVTDPEEIKFHAVAHFDKDGFQDDNVTPVFTCNLLLPEYPEPYGLKAEATTEGVRLQWEEPADQHVTPVASTEDFEGYDSWEYQDISPWTLYDGDGYTNGMFENLVFPFGYTKTSFFVFDNTDSSVIPVGYENSFGAYSGHKFMANVFSDGKEGSIVDDWLISPELTGQAQTVSFYARSYHNQDLESFEILFSRSENDPDYFEFLKAYTGLPNQWTCINAELPKGAKYFAIRCVSNNRYLMFVDNVTMVLANGPVDLARRVGYNVYRDGVKLNNAPVASPQFVEAGAKDDGQSYFVTSVFDKGESRPSSAVRVGQTALGQVASAGVEVAVNGRTITVANAAGVSVSVYAVDGRTVLSETSEGTSRVTVAPGVYLVQAGRDAIKVVVR